MVLAFLLPRLCRLQPRLAMSTGTGTFSLQQPLNYRAGGRVEPVDGRQTEDVYEPATGTCCPNFFGVNSFVCLEGGRMGRRKTGGVAVCDDGSWCWWWEGNELKKKPAEIGADERPECGCGGGQALGFTSRAAELLHNRVSLGGSREALWWN